MNNDDFRKHAHDLVDWMADYLENVRQYPVKSQVQPKDIINQLPAGPPSGGESFETIFADFERIIMPGITHWQHPSFFAYFPANSSEPSVLAEMLTATLAPQCMIWQTSPAAAELEERIMQWLGQMIGLPDTFTGVIQDTASTATLVSILTAREKHSEFQINEHGFAGRPRYTVYGSSESHSSVEKAVKVAGLGRDSLRKVEADHNFALRPDLLEKVIVRDIEHGFTPLCAVVTIGTTSSTAVDPLRAIGEICHKHKIFLHVDAAYAGNALLLPEMRHLIDGIEYVDTFVFNPHKWMLTNFDCSAYFVRDKSALIRNFEVLPEYLKTAEGSRVNNYRDWGIQLGRRFRALKLWFVIRSYGVEGLQAIIRRHLVMAKTVRGWIEAADDFDVLAPTTFSLICFRYHPKGVDDPETLNALNERILAAINATGKLYMTHTKLRGAYTIRMVISQTHVTEDDVSEAWKIIQNVARGMK